MMKDERKSKSVMWSFSLSQISGPMYILMHLLFVSDRSARGPTARNLYRSMQQGLCRFILSPEKTLYIYIYMCVATHSTTL